MGAQKRVTLKRKKKGKKTGIRLIALIKIERGKLDSKLMPILTDFYKNAILVLFSFWVT